MQKASGLTSQQQSEVKQMIECALLGFKVSISNELSLLNQLLQEPTQEKSQVLEMSPIQPFGLTMDNTKEQLGSSSLESEEKLDIPLILKQSEAKQSEASQKEAPEKVKTKIAFKAQTKAMTLGNKKVLKKPPLNESRNVNKRMPLKECPSVLTKKKL